MEHNLSLQFNSSVKDVTDINESFSSGRMRVCYTGPNPNNSDISKESIERAIPSMFNCPVVCNYDIGSDTIGGHDMDVVCDDSGAMRMINLTSAVGVVPSEAKYDWELVDDDGTEHEYFCTDVILWKRSPAYQKIVNDGITGQSMEITVKEGAIKDGVFIVSDFIFTAFCLLGEDVAPCFKSASLQMFSGNDKLKEQFGELMREMKESFSAEAQERKDFCLEGGDVPVDQKVELMEKYGFNKEMLDFELDDYSIDELTQKFEEMKKSFADDDEAGGAGTETEGGEDTGDADDGSGGGNSGGEETPTDNAEDSAAEDDDDDEPVRRNYSLNSELMDAIRRALNAAGKIQTKWGEEYHYWMVDVDNEASEVYCYDSTDGLLYGFSFSKNGDAVSIDWESKKRKKFAIVDFVENESEPPSAFAALIDSVGNAFDACNAELETLREFKADIEKQEADAERSAVIEQFADLNGNEDFEALCEDAEKYEAKELEEKFFAIRGRQMSMTFAAKNNKGHKLPVERRNRTEDDEPYGGVFKEFGIV